jgi:hypothetical protein
MKGSCLYGAVRFNVTGTPTDFDLCHCSRCREASGSAFLAELEFEGAEFEWVSGRSLVKTHGAPVRKIPPGYRRAFCTVSGSPVPIVDRAWFVSLPGPTLDQDPGIRPQRHIFVDFKALWFEIIDTLSQFVTKPKFS